MLLFWATQKTKIAVTVSKTVLPLPIILEASMGALLKDVAYLETKADLPHLELEQFIEILETSPFLLPKLSVNCREDPQRLHLVISRALDNASNFMCLYAMPTPPAMLLISGGGDITVGEQHNANFSLVAEDRGLPEFLCVPEV